MRRALVVLAVVAMTVGVSHAGAAPKTVLFRDDFTGTTLNLSKWQPNWLAGNNTDITHPVNGAELSCYAPSQAAVTNGLLALTAVAKSCTDRDGRRWSYASGLVNTHDHFTFTYGTIKARVYLPGGTTIADWPGVWADGTGQWPATGENDVMEGLDGRACFHFHSNSGGPGGCASGSFTGWHTYASTWSPGKVVYKYDGATVGTITQGVTASPMYLIVNLGISTQISPPVVTPATMLVDWIKVVR